MAVYTNASQLSAVYRRRAQAVRPAFRRAMQASTMEIKRTAMEFSSRTGLPPAALRRLGHPFAARLPKDSGPYPDSQIGQRTGRFRAGWRAQTRETADGLEGQVWNDAPQARFMLGTRKMRKRPILERAAQVCRLRVQQEFRAAQQDVITIS